MTNKTRVNYASAARTANGFHSAAILLHKSSEWLLSAVPKGQSQDKQTIESVVQLLGHTSASVVLHAFSIEVLLKALHGKSSQSPPPIHPLGKLFSGLSTATQTAVERLYANRLKAHESHTGVGLTGTLSALLNESANAFEKWRYNYERNNTTLSACVGELQLAFESLYEQYITP